MKALRRGSKSEFNDIYTVVDESNEDQAFYIGPSTLISDTEQQQTERPSTPEEKQKIDALFQQLAPNLEAFKQLHPAIDWHGSVHDDGKKRYCLIHLNVPNHDGTDLGNMLIVPD